MIHLSMLSSPTPRRALVPLLSTLLAACASGGASGASPTPAAGAPSAARAVAADVPAPGALPLKYAPRPTSGPITAGDLMSRLYVFSDDSLMGRDAGTEGSYKATALLAKEAERLGLKPAGENGTYFQNLPLKERNIDRGTSTLSIGGSAMAIGSVWGASGQSPLAIDNSPVIFGGAITALAPLTEAQVTGKVVVITVPAPDAQLNRAVFSSESFAPKGAAGVLVVLPSGPAAGSVVAYVGRRDVSMSVGAPAAGRIFLHPDSANALFGKSLSAVTAGEVGKTISARANITLRDIQFPARNVVAILPGSDPVLKNQYVAIGAHSDHVGMSPRAADHDSILIFNRIVRPGGAEDNAMGNAEQFARINSELATLRKTKPSRRDSIFNGADDDGSGSVSVQEIAEYLSTLPTKPKRSTLFVWHVGEEKGLWGSQYYTEHPTVPRDSIVAQLNMDMVGRGAATDETGKSKDGASLFGGPNYLQLVGSRRLSTELGDLIERVNKEKGYGLTFDYGMDANGHPMNIYCRSDHYEYAKWNIPVTFFTTGGHSAYHQLTDEAQYIDYAHMTRIARFVADVALEVSNRPARPRVDGAKMDPRGTCKQ